MERRSFLKFLGLTAVAPKAAVEVLSKIEPVPVVHPKLIYGKVSIISDPTIWGKGMSEILRDHMKAHERVYAQFCADISFFKGRH